MNRHLLVVGCALAAGSASAQPDAAVRPQLEHVTAIEESIIAGGWHWRVETEAGPVHVWRPLGYDARTAGIVIYVHGYWVDLDTAWQDHHLAEQFAAASVNALFLVPEAPRGRNEEPRWDHIEDLIQAALEPSGMPQPQGPIVVVGHSGAFEQISRWLDDAKPIDHIILIDALYAYGDQFRAWLERAAPRPHQLTVIAKHTLPRVRRWKKLMQLATRINGVPDRLVALPRRVQAARFLFVVSQYEHEELVTSGKTVPVFLHRTRLPRIGAGSTLGRGAGSRPDSSCAHCSPG